MTGIADDTGTWIRRFHRAPEDARSSQGTAGPVRLACFPFAGGAASYYFPVSKALAPQVEVLSVQYPGRQDRLSEPCAQSVDELAEQVLPRLRPWAGPQLALFGHSLGASVAFEVARRLEAEGAPPRALFVSARTAPTRNLDEGVHRLADEEFLQVVQQLGGLPAEVLANREVLRMVLPVLRADYRAAETYAYRPGTDVSCPLHALLGTEDPKVAEDEMLDWRLRTSGEFRLHRFSGGHFYLGEHLPEILRLVTGELGVGQS